MKAVEKFGRGHRLPTDFRHRALLYRISVAPAAVELATRQQAQSSSNSEPGSMAGLFFCRAARLRLEDT
jgi:hypothetical protein